MTASGNRDHLTLDADKRKKKTPDSGVVAFNGCQGFPLLLTIVYRRFYDSVNLFFDGNIVLRPRRSPATAYFFETMRQSFFIKPILPNNSQYNKTSITSIGMP